jgi:hypothetical protein
MPKYKVKVSSFRTIVKETEIEIEAENQSEAESVGMQKVLNNDDFWKDVDEKLVNNDYGSEVIEE